MSDQNMSPEERKARARLRELDAQIEALSAKADRIEADAEIKGKDIIDSIRQKRDAAAARLEELKSNSGSALDELRSGFSKAVDDLSDAVKRATGQFDDSAKK